MEYSGLVMIAQDTFARKKAASKEDYDSVIEDVSHEVAHQWFFNTVGNDEYTEPWLDEGMAEFSEDIIFDLSSGAIKDMIELLCILISIITIL